MNAEIQTVIALAIVAATVTWLLFRAMAKRKNPGCGGCSACPPSELKTKIRS